MRSDPDGSALAVPCRKCGSKAGRRCRNTAGPGWFTTVHNERWADAADLPEHVPATTVEAWQDSVRVYLRGQNKRPGTRPGR